MQGQRKSIGRAKWMSYLLLIAFGSAAVAGLLSYSLRPEPQYAMGAAVLGASAGLFNFFVFFAKAFSPKSPVNEVGH